MSQRAQSNQISLYRLKLFAVDENQTRRELTTEITEDTEIFFVYFVCSVFKKGITEMAETKESTKKLIYMLIFAVLFVYLVFKAITEGMNPLKILLPVITLIFIALNYSQWMRTKREEN